MCFQKQPASSALSLRYHVVYKYQATNFKASLKQRIMKYTYSSGKSSYSKVAATIYGRGMGLSFCKKITEKNEETKHSRLHRD